MDRRAHYLEIALRLFIEHGYHGVSMDTIVSEAGGSKATLYRYFDSKDALFSAIVDSLQSQLAGAPAPTELNELGLEEGLRILGTATAVGALSERAIVLMRLAVGEHGRFPQLAKLLFELAPAKSYERLRSFLELKHRHGEIDIGDSQIAAEHFLAGLVGHQQLKMLLGAGTPTEGEIQQRIDAAIEMFIRAYGTTASD